MTLDGAPSPENNYHWEHVRHLLYSYQRFLGRSLLDGQSIASGREVFYAPFALVSHGVQADPIFNYANQAALDLFEMSWSAFTSMPSKYSAEPLSREARAELLSRVTQFNYIDDYSGIRIAKSGRRFHIQQAVVWNVFHQDTDDYLGQAAAFEHWHYVESEG